MTTTMLSSLLSRLTIVSAMVLFFSFAGISAELNYLDIFKKIDDTELGEEQERNLLLNPKDVYDCISDLLTKLAENNESFPAHQSALNDKFSCPSQQYFTFCDYVSRFGKHLNYEPSVLISALIHIDKFVVKTGIKVTKFNIFRIFLVSVVVTQKFILDKPYQNKYMADVGGITSSELKKLESEFLFAIHFELTIDGKRYREYAVAIEKRIAQIKNGDYEKSLRDHARLQEAVAKVLTHDPSLKELTLHLTGGSDTNT